MGKLVVAMIVTVFSFFLAFWPEMLMYGCYHLVNPQTDIAKIIMILGFWGLGAGVSVLFGFIGIYFWVYMMNEIVK